MKKEMIILILLATFIPFVVSESAPQAPDLSTIRGGLDSQTENLLERQIQIPSFLEIPVKIIFGFDSNSPISITQLVIMFGVWIMFFVLIQGALKVSPILNKGAINIGGSIVITILIAMTGSLNALTLWIYHMGDTFEWIASLGQFQVFVGLIFIGLVIVLGRFFANKIERKFILAKAEHTAENISMASKMGESLSENADTISSR